MSPDDGAVTVDGRSVKVSHLDKVLYPQTGTTKAEVLQHYVRVAPVLLPLMSGRCVTRIRWPHGIGGHSFIEKNVPAGAPDWIRVVEVPGTEGSVRYPVVDGLASLVWLVNLSALELHVHQWRVGANDERLPADRLVVDLDPGESAGLTECAAVALLARSWLAEHGLRCSPVLSGSKGIHLYAALLSGDQGAAADPSLDVAKDLARQMADDLQRQHPDLVTANMSRAVRQGKVFVDWSQNSRSKTTLNPYSLRGREQPTVAAPLAWEEVERGAAEPGRLTQVNLDDFPARFGRHPDLLHGL